MILNKMAALFSYPFRLSPNNYRQLPLPLSIKGIRSSSFRGTNTAKLNIFLSRGGRVLPYQGAEAAGPPRFAGGFESELNCSRLAIGRVEPRLNRIPIMSTLSSANLLRWEKAFELDFESGAHCRNSALFLAERASSEHRPLRRPELSKQRSEPQPSLAHFRPSEPQANIRPLSGNRATSEDCPLRRQESPKRT